MKTAMGSRATSIKEVIYTIAFFLFIQNGYGQEKTYKDSIDDITLKQIKKGSKTFRDHDKHAKRHYWYNKRSNQIVSIVIGYHNEHSAVYYDFLDNELVSMRIDLPYSAMPSSRGKPMHSAYYFKDGALVAKYEVNFPTVDIEEYKKEGFELYKRAEMYLKNKGILK